jgi:hypothetical protein
MALTKENVAQLYVAMFERVPEKEGFDAWYNAAIENNWGLGELAQSMLTAAEQVVNTSDEYAEIYPQYVNVNSSSEESVRDIIENVYQTLFNKSYTDDPVGIDTWVKSVTEDGQSIGNVVASITTIANQLASDSNLDEDTKKAVDTYKNKVDVALYGAEEIDSADIDKDGKVEPEDLKELQEPLELVNDTPESVEAAKEKVEELAQEIFDLTPADEVIVGTEKDDIFNGVVSTSSSDKTLSSADKIDGEDGTDTLNINLMSSFSGFTTGGVTNVENIVLTNTSTISRSFNSDGIEGAESYTLNSETKEISALTNLEKSVAITINDQAKGSFETSFAEDASEVSGTEDVMNLTLKDVGTVETDNVSEESVEITLNDIEEVNLNVSGDNNIVEFAGEDLKTLNVSGQADVKITDVSSSLENLKASELEGNLAINLSEVDTLKTLETGVGNDSVALAADTTSTDMVLTDSGGDDILVLNSEASTTTAYNMSGFETLQIGKTSGDLTFSGENVADVNKIVVTKDIGGKVEIYKMATADLTIEATDAITAQDIVTDNIGSVVLDYKTEEGIIQDSKANFNFLKAQDATINVNDNIKVSGIVDTTDAKSLALNVSSKGEFDGTLKATNATDLTINSDGGAVVAAAGSNLKSLESLIVKGANTIDLSNVGDLVSVSDVEIEATGSDKTVTLGNIGKTDHDISVKVSNYGNTTIGNIDAQTAVVDLSKTYGTNTLGDITVSEKLDYTAGLNGGAVNVIVDNSATSTDIKLTGDVKNDVFNITSKTTNGVTIAVDGDLGNGTNDAVIINASEATGDVAVNLGKLKDTETVSITTGTGADSIIGADGADNINTGAGADNISAGDGADIIDAGAGADIIDAGAGDDEITIDVDDIKIDGGIGSDSVFYTGSASLDFTGETKTITNVEFIDVSGASGGIDLQMDASDLYEFTFTGAGTSAAADTLSVTGGEGEDTADLSAITLKDATSEIKLGNGNDKAILSDGVDQFIFEQTADDNGFDTISNFTVGSAGDQLNLHMFLAGSANFDSALVASAGDLVEDSGNAYTMDAGTATDITDKIVFISSDEITDADALKDAIGDNDNGLFSSFNMSADSNAFILVSDSSDTDDVHLYFVSTGTTGDTGSGDDSDSYTITEVGVIENVDIDDFTSDNFFI